MASGRSPDTVSASEEALSAVANEQRITKVALELSHARASSQRRLHANSSWKEKRLAELEQEQEQMNDRVHQMELDYEALRFPPLLHDDHSCEERMPRQGQRDFDQRLYDLEVSTRANPARQLSPSLPCHRPSPPPTPHAHLHASRSPPTPSSHHPPLTARSTS